MKSQSFYQRNEALILGGISVVIVLGVWQLAWSTGWPFKISPLFFSGPSAIWQALLEGLDTEKGGTLLQDMRFSGKNFVVGLGFAILVGVVLGVIIGWYRRIRLLVDPFFSALYATPRVALIPIIIMSLGIDWKSKAFIVFMSAVFPILVNTVAGVRTLDADLLRAARAFCASDWQIFKTIALPGSVPFILTGVRQGVALGLIGVVVGEMYGGSEGIGYSVMFSGQTFRTDATFLGVIIIAFAGMLLTGVAEKLEQRFSRWRPDR
jgi:NitT/TauT family transport system permease protein